MPHGTDDTHPISLPDKPALEGLEEKWKARWQEAGTYRFDRGRARADVFSIDTPPPTVSGSLHVGHVFSYTHTDIIARFHRMRHRDSRRASNGRMTSTSVRASWRGFLQKRARQQARWIMSCSASGSTYAGPRIHQTWSRERRHSKASLAAMWTGDWC